jgi:DNA-binding CsgD family transcriptional regulator
MDRHPGAVRCPLLIGRDELLDLADRRLDDVEAGRGQFLLVAGEAGIGKTRFLDAIDQKAAERGLVTAWGFLAPQDGDVPAALILDLARSMLRDPVFSDLGRDLLELRERTVEAEHVRRRQLVMEVVDRMLAALPHAALLGFEDLQWADDLSLEIVGELARRSRDRRLLLAGGYRTDEAPPGTSLRDWRSRLLTQRIAEEVRLTPLTQADTALVTTLILDTGLPAPREVAAAVYERTDGIPLHIEELLGALGAEARANGTAIREATVPDTIEDAVLARLSHRSAEAQLVARAGAIIGRCFVPEVLAGIMDVPPETLDAPIQELIDHYVLEPPGSRGLYDFRHQLLRDAIYWSVPLGERRRFHARAGEFGAALEGASEIHASLHFERAGLRLQAYRTALSGARAAARLSAHREATELYRRAVDNLPDDVGSGERALILEEYSGEAGAIEELAIAERMAREAATAYRAAGDPVGAIRSLGMVAAVWRRDGHPVSERLAFMRELWAELESLPDGRETSYARGDLAANLGIAYTDGRSLPDARAALGTLRQTGDLIDDPEFRLVADWKDGVIDFAEGRIAAGLERVGAAALEAERTGYEMTGVSAFRDAATMAASVMDYAAAARWIGEGVRYADTVEQSHCSHVLRATSAMVAWAGADWTEAVVQGRQAVADRGCRRGAGMARWALGYVALGQGDPETAERELDDSLRFGEHSEAIDLILPPLWGLAEMALLAGDPDLAAGRCQYALGLATSTGERALMAPFVVTGVRAHLAIGRIDAATDWLEACDGQLAAMPSVGEAALSHGQGLIALAQGATGTARTALETAVRLWDARGRTWEAAWARLDLATCLVRSNRFADAAPLVVDVRSLASRLDSRPLAERADALLRMARGRFAVDEPWRPLTAREFAVARLITDGLTNAEIASSLGIAPKTASSHVEHILAKLGASRRAEVAVWASQIERSAAPH